ncbi:MAG: gliding motility-associated C-terminal domain-containing protein [Bacteroidales bacterium]
MEVTNQFGCSAIDSIQIGYYADPLLFNLGADTSFCTDTYFLINAGSGYTSYAWQDGSNDSIFITNQPGTYYVDVYNPCGNNTDTIVLTNYPVQEANLRNDSILCHGDFVLLNPGFGFTSFLWQDGSTNQFLYTGQTGIYWVDITDSNTCHNIDSIYLEFVLPDPNLGTDTIMCPWDSITFHADSQFVTFLWHDNSIQNYYVADTSGIFWCEVTDTMGCVGRDTINLDILLPPHVGIGNDTSICIFDSIELSPGYDKYYHDYIWQDGSTDSTLLISEQGLYWVEVTNVCGSDMDSLYLSLIELPFVFIGNDTVLALNDELELDAGYGFDAYFWNTESSQQTIVVKEKGTYWVEVFDGLCYNRDSIYIEHVDCDVFIPIVFTPNGDHFNDYFYASGFNDISEFNMTVFNRWGETIWEADRISLRWDGTRNGKEADTGTYFWVAQYKCTASDQDFIKKGSVTLMR